MKSTILFTTLSVLLLAGSAWAAHPDAAPRYAVTRVQIEEVQKLAHEVEGLSRAVHRGAERSAHHRSYREERALTRLHELEDSARHFHRQVETYGQSFLHTEADFRDLRRAYARASYAMRDAHTIRKVTREFDRLSDAMYELEMYAEDLFDRLRPANRRYRDRSHRNRDYRDRRDWDGDSDSDFRRGRARIVLPRVRVSWDWLDR